MGEEGEETKIPAGSVKDGGIHIKFHSLKSENFSRSCSLFAEATRAASFCRSDA